MWPQRACGSRVLFLWELRDLRVQEFLREIVVGVAAPGDLAGSVIMKILHCGESGNVKQVAQTSKQISRVCDCLSLSLSLMFISCMFIIIVLMYYMLNIACAT